jgi:hypothetical protein
LEQGCGLLAYLAISELQTDWLGLKAQYN